MPVKLTACARPCASCPWRADDTGYVYPNLSDYAADTIPSEPDFGTTPKDKAEDQAVDQAEEQLAPFGTMFACHRTADTDPKLCAGWLVVVGGEHPLIRLALALELLDPDALRSKEGWPPLFASYQAMLAAVGG